MLGGEPWYHDRNNNVPNMQHAHHIRASRPVTHKHIIIHCDQQVYSYLKPLPSLTHHDSIFIPASARVFADTHTIHEERHSVPRLEDCPLDSRHCDSKPIPVVVLVRKVVVYANVYLNGEIENRK